MVNTSYILAFKMAAALLLLGLMLTLFLRDIVQLFIN